VLCCSLFLPLTPDTAIRFSSGCKPLRVAFRYQRTQHRWTRSVLDVVYQHGLLERAVCAPAARGFRTYYFPFRTPLFCGRLRAPFRYAHFAGSAGRLLVAFTAYAHFFWTPDTYSRILRARFVGFTLGCFALPVFMPRSTFPICLRCRWNSSAPPFCCGIPRLACAAAHTDTPTPRCWLPVPDLPCRLLPFAVLLHTPFFFLPFEHRATTDFVSLCWVHCVFAPPALLPFTACVCFARTNFPPRHGAGSPNIPYAVACARLPPSLYAPRAWTRLATLDVAAHSHTVCITGCTVPPRRACRLRAPVAAQLLDAYNAFERFLCVYRQPDAARQFPFMRYIYRLPRRVCYVRCRCAVRTYTHVYHCCLTHVCHVGFIPRVLHATPALPFTYLRF